MSVGGGGSGADDAPAGAEDAPVDPGRRAAFERYRDLLAAADFRPSRRLGQNFLLDPTLHRCIADEAALTPRDVVLEAGPGLGFLTRELAARAGRVVAVEVDARLHAVLARELATFRDGGADVRLLHGDVLAGRHRLHPEAVAAVREALGELGGRFAVVANLPYAITGPFLAAIVMLERPPDHAVLLLQHDLAVRLVAPPASRDYGTLSALVQLAYEVRIRRKVGREVFRPRPNVESAIVTFRRGEAAPLLSRRPVEREAFATFLQALFASRRKQLRNALPRAFLAAGRPVESLSAAALAAAARRPEELAPRELLRLWDDAIGGDQ